MNIDYAMAREDIGRALGGISRERVRQIEGGALLKLRHPSRSCALRDFYDVDGGGVPAYFGPGGSERNGCVWHRARPGCP